MSDDRKYRHRGYMDSGSAPSPRRPGPGARRDDGAPRGRGIDQDKAVVFRCKHCGEKVLDVDLESVGVAATCRKCGAALHSCSQCTHFDTSARFECTQPIPARIPSKKAANDCSFYAPARTFDLTGSRGVATPDDARAAFDQLFKKKP